MHRSDRPSIPASVSRSFRADIFPDLYDLTDVAGREQYIICMI